MQTLAVLSAVFLSFQNCAPTSGFKDINSGSTDSGSTDGSGNPAGNPSDEAGSTTTTVTLPGSTTTSTTTTTSVTSTTQAPTGSSTTTSTTSTTTTSVTTTSTTTSTTMPSVPVTDADCGTGRTFYMDDTGGNDSAAGTSMAPFATFTGAFSKMEAGDKLIVRDGTYNQSLVGPPNGTAASYTCVMSENLFGATVDAEGKSEPALTILGSNHHIIISGFHFRGANNSGADSVVSIGPNVSSSDINTTPSTAGSSYIQIKKNLMESRNQGQSGKWSTSTNIGFSNHILFEENTFFGKVNKYHLQAFKSDYVTLRRNLVRWDPVTTSLQSTEGQPSGSIILYDTTNSIVENNLAIDGVQTSFSDTWVFAVVSNYSQGCSNNSLLGNIALNNKAAAAFDFEPAVGRCNNQKVINNIAWDVGTNSNGVAFNFFPRNSLMDGVVNTVSNNTSGLVGYGFGLWDDASQITVSNNLFLFSNSGISDSGQTSKSGNLLFSGSSKTAISPALTDITRGISSNVGAKVVKRYKDGVLQVTENLWPWPNEVEIYYQLCTKQDPTKWRGFCLKPSITNYIQTY